MGDTLKQKYNGYTAWVISSDMIALKQLGLYPSRKLELYNGPLECRFEKFEVYEGSKKEKNKTHAVKTKNYSKEGPSYRKKPDWDKEGKKTRFKGKTKGEWEIDNRTNKKNPNEDKGSKKETKRIPREEVSAPKEKTVYFPKGRPPRKRIPKKPDNT